MKQKNIKYSFSSSVKSKNNVEMFKYWAQQVFKIMESATQKQIMSDINVSVSSNLDNPFSLPNAKPIKIYLAMASLSYWSQEVYQLAHEYCHVLIDSPYNPQMRDEWFEEVICECASRFVLVKINENDLAKKNYAGNFINYEKDLTNQKTYSFKLKSLSNESSEILTKLRNDHELREPQCYLANIIYPLIAENDAFWQSIPGLANFNNENTFIENLNIWCKKAPRPTKPQIAEIIKLFNNN